MILWRRNVKISHHSINSGPLNFSLLYLIIAFAIVIVSPFLMVFYADRIFDQTETKMLELNVIHAKEAVLILYQADGQKIFSPGVPTIVPAEDLADCSFTISQSPNDMSQIKTSFECATPNVIGFDLYTYFNMKLNGFNSAGSGYVTQLITSSAAGISISSKASFYSRVELKQYRINDQDSSHLLPAGDISISDGFLPSTQEFLWTPEEAISNHSARSIRFQETNLQSRFAPGDISSIIIEGNYEFPTVMAERQLKMWTGIKYGLIQYLAFFFVFAYFFSKLTDFLFESGVLLSFMKAENLQRAKRG